MKFFWVLSLLRARSEFSSIYGIGVCWLNYTGPHRRCKSRYSRGGWKQPGAIILGVRHWHCALCVYRISHRVDTIHTNPESKNIRYINFIIHRPVYNTFVKFCSIRKSHQGNNRNTFYISPIIPLTGRWRRQCYAVGRTGQSSLC